MRLGELELWGEIRQSVCVKEIRISYKNGQFLIQNAQSHFCIIRLPQLSSGSMIQSYMTDINIAVCDEGSQITERNLCKNLTSNKHLRFSVKSPLPRSQVPVQSIRCKLNVPLHINCSKDYIPCTWYFKQIANNLLNKNIIPLADFLSFY